MSTDAWGVQQAVYAALVNAEPPIAGGRIYDDTPESEATEFPYVEIGESQFVADDVQCRRGGDAFVDLHIWSRYRGQREAKLIADRIDDVLHDAVLAVPGQASVHLWVQTVRVFKDPDGVTRHGVVTLRIQHFSNLIS